MEVNIDSVKILVDQLPKNRVQLRHVTPYGQVLRSNRLLHSPCKSCCILREVSENYVPAFFNTIKQTYEDQKTEQPSPSRY